MIAPTRQTTRGWFNEGTASRLHGCAIVLRRSVSRDNGKAADVDRTLKCSESSTVDPRYFLKHALLGIGSVPVLEQIHAELKRVEKWLHPCAKASPLFGSPSSKDPVDHKPFCFVPHCATPIEVRVVWSASSQDLQQFDFGGMLTSDQRGSRSCCACVRWKQKHNTE